jgi:hypothetical protein
MGGWETVKAKLELAFGFAPGADPDAARCAAAIKARNPKLSSTDDVIIIGMHGKQLSELLNADKKSITTGMLIAAVNAGIYLEVCITIARPFIEHTMLSAVVTVAGRDTGATLFGPADMQVSANTSVKTIEGCVAFWNACVAPALRLRCALAFSDMFVSLDSRPLVYPPTDITRAPRRRTTPLSPDEPTPCLLESPVSPVFVFVAGATPSRSSQSRRTCTLCVTSCAAATLQVETPSFLARQALPGNLPARVQLWIS